MSLNIVPVYGKQLIRFAETYTAASNTEAGVVGTVELFEFRAVAIAPYAGAGVVCPPSALDVPGGAIVGINQSYIPTANAEPHTARQASVATSGSLLVEVAPADVAAFVAGSRLRIDTAGRAVSSAGALTTLNGTTPLVRETVAIGGKRFVVVSFT